MLDINRFLILLTGPSVYKYGFTEYGLQNMLASRR